jgi:hypothetical protein
MDDRADYIRQIMQMKFDKDLDQSFSSNSTVRAPKAGTKRKEENLQNLGAKSMGTKA